MAEIYQVTEAAKFSTHLIVNRKLADGTWGVYGPAELIVPGTTVTVTAASGRTRREYITEIVRTSTARGRTMAFARTGTAPAARKSHATGGCRWAKTLNGQWVVMGARDVVTPGATITVTKRSGETQTILIGDHVEHDVDDEGRPVALGGPAPRKTSRHRTQNSAATCAECGGRRGTVECQDSSGITALCCQRCAAMAWYERSFA